MGYIQTVSHEIVKLPGGAGAVISDDELFTPGFFLNGQQVGFCQVFHLDPRDMVVTCADSPEPATNHHVVHFQEQSSITIDLPGYYLYYSWFMIPEEIFYQLILLPGSTGYADLIVFASRIRSQYNPMPAAGRGQYPFRKYA